MRDAQAFFDALPADRRPALSGLIDTLRAHLPDGFSEHGDGRMVHFSVPHSLYPDGYHCNPSQPLPFISVASTKGHMALHHMGLYADPDLLAGFHADWEKAKLGRLDMGKGCVRFKKPDTLLAAMPVLSALFERMAPSDWIAQYEAAIKR